MRIDAEGWSETTQSQLSDRLHDRWFDLRSVRHDKSAGTWCVAMGERRTGPFDAHILVSCVLSAEVADSAGIRFFDISSFTIDPSGPTVTIRSGFPLVIDLKLGQGWQVEVDQSSSC